MTREDKHAACVQLIVETTAEVSPLSGGRQTADGQFTSPPVAVIVIGHNAGESVQRTGTNEWELEYRLERCMTDSVLQLLLGAGAHLCHSLHVCVR